MNIETEIARLKEEGYSKTKAAEKLGFSRWKLEGMLEALGIDWPKQRRGSYEVNGLRRTLEQHAKNTGLSISGLHRRLRNGQDANSPAAIVPVTKEEAGRFAELRQQGMPAWQAAQEIGRPYNTLKNAAKRLIPNYEEIVSTAPRIRRSSDEIDLAS